MGYRSEVCFEINAPKKVILKELAALRLSYENPQALKEAFGHLKFHGHGLIGLIGNFAILRFHADAWEWRFDRENVKALWEIWCHFESAAEEDGNISGQFIRIGEDSDDVAKQEFNDYGNMYVPSPSICFDQNFSEGSVTLEEFKGEKDEV